MAKFLMSQSIGLKKQKQFKLQILDTSVYK